MPIKKTAAKKTVIKKPVAKKIASKSAGKKTEEKKQKLKNTMPKKPVEKKPAVKKTVAKKAEAKKTAGKTAIKNTEAQKTAVKAATKKTEAKKTAGKPATKKPEFDSSLMIQGATFLKSPFFVDIEKEYGSKHKYLSQHKQPEKPTACSRLKMGGALDGKSLVEFLSQKLEYENRTYFEGCEGQICVKCNVNNVDQKFYVDKSLGYCIECATLLNLGQSKEGVFSDAQMELMRRSMEKSMASAKDIESEDDIESTFGDMEELEEAMLAIEEAEFDA
jgi:hypothetical protein